MKVAVLMGGTSSEREISLKTGNAVYPAIEKAGHRVEKYDWSETEVVNRIKELEKFDVIFIAYHGGLGEDGHIQGVLDVYNLKYTGSGHFASALGMNKIASLNLFESVGIETPPGFFVYSYQKDKESKVLSGMKEEGFSFPIIIKPSTGGSTIGLSKVEDKADVDKAIEEATQYSEDFIVEKFIDGRELTVSILAGRPLPPVEIKPTHECYDYTCKYTEGKSEYFCPAELEPSVEDKLKKYARNAFRVLDCENYARVDFKVREQEVFCLEVNTLPGMTSLSLVPMAAEAEGISFPELMDKILDDAVSE